MTRPVLGRRAAPGFTLIEVMVAMVVMAIMAVMAWQGVDGIVRTRTISQARMERTLRLNTVIAQWDLDLASVQQTAVLTSVLRCDGASVRLVRKTPDGLQVVAWTVRPSEAGGGTWVRWAGPSVTTAGELTASWARSLQLQGNEPESLKTLTGLTGWQVYFFRDNAWSNCQSSAGNTMPAGGNVSAGPEPLPSGVRIVLAFAGGEGGEGALTRDTLVMAQ